MKLENIIFKGLAVVPFYLLPLVPMIFWKTLQTVIWTKNPYQE